MAGKLGIQDILRAGSVKRWNIVRTANNQTLAEHLFNVTMIARAIAKKANMDDGPVIKAALEHDLDEVIYGDIPTPTKRMMEANGVEFDIIDNRPDRGDDVHIIVKAADYVEAVWFLGENRIGRHAEAAFNNIKQRFDDFYTSIPNQTIKDAVIDVYLDIRSGAFKIQ